MIGTVADDVVDRIDPAVLRRLVKATMGTSGASWFRPFVQHLALALDVKQALIGEIVPLDRVRVLAHFNDGGFVDELELGRKELLARLGRSFATSLFDEVGVPVGVIFVANDNGMAEDESARAVVSILARRATVELALLRSRRAPSESQRLDLEGHLHQILRASLETLGVARASFIAVDGSIASEGRADEDLMHDRTMFDGGLRLDVDVKLGGNKLGYLRLDADAPRLWSTDELELSVSLAAQLAHAIDSNEQHRAAARIRLIAEVTRDVVLEWDLVHHRLEWSDGLLTTLGHEPSTSADFWVEHMHPEDRDRVTHSFDVALAARDRTWSDELRFRRVDGTYAYMLVRGVIERSSTGMATRMTAVLIEAKALKV